MKKYLLTIVAMAAFSSAAFAGGNSNNTGGCRGNCSGGTPSAGGEATGVGVGIGVGVGTGGNASATNNNNVSNTNNNAAVGVGTGGAGGAGGGGGSASAGSSSSSTSSSNSGGNTQTATTGHQTTQVNVQGDTVKYEAQKRDPVSTAYAGHLTTSNGTCMGSSSAGAQGVSFGVSIGSTWVDGGCDARYDASALLAMGEFTAARARLCLKPEIAEAFKRSGKPCPETKTAEVPGAQLSVSNQTSNVYMN